MKLKITEEEVSELGLLVIGDALNKLVATLSRRVGYELRHAEREMLSPINDMLSREWAEERKAKGETRCGIYCMKDAQKGYGHSFFLLEHPPCFKKME